MFWYCNVANSVLCLYSKGQGFFLPRFNSPSEPRFPYYREFVVTHRHTTFGRTPLDEWSARRRDLYLTTQKIHKRETSTPPVGFEPTIPASELLQTHILDRATTKGQVLIKINKLRLLLLWYLRRIPMLIKHPTLMCNQTYKCLCPATVQNQAVLCTLRAVRIYIDRNKTWVYQYQQPLADERTNHTSHTINTMHPTNHMFEDNKSFYFTPNAFLLIFLRFLLHLWFSIMFQIMAHYFVTPSFAACFLLALSLIFCFLLTEHLFLFGSFILFSSFYQHFYKRKCGYQISTVAMGTEGSGE